MRRFDRENRMNGTKKRKRFVEGLKKAVVYLLCISMIAGSMPAGIALAAEGDETEETVSEYREEDTSFFLDYDNLYNSIEDALKNDNVTDASDLNFSGNAKDDYERLFENYGDLYELKPDVETEGEGLSLQVFFRSADGWILSEPEYEEYYDEEEYPDDEIYDEGYEDYEDYEEYYDDEYELTYELTGDEDIIFLLINDGSEEKTGRVYIDDEFATPVITVAPSDEADNVSTVSSVSKSYSSRIRSESSSSAVRAESSSSAVRVESSSNSSGRSESYSEETSEESAEDTDGFIVISGILCDTVILNDTSSAAAFITTTADLGMAYGIMTLAVQTVKDVNGITYTYVSKFNLWIYTQDDKKVAGYSDRPSYYGDKKNALENEVLSYRDTDGEVYYLIPEKYFSENLKSYGYDFDENRDNDVCPFRYMPNAHQYYDLKNNPPDKAEYYPVTTVENGKETTTWYVRVQDTTGMKPNRSNIFYYPVYEEIEFEMWVYDKDGTEVASHSSPDIKDAIEYLDNGTTYYLIPVEYFEEDLKKYGYEFSEEIADKYCPFRYVPNANTNATLEAATGKAEYKYLYMEENGEEVKKWYLSVQDTTGLTPHRSNIFYTPADGKFVLNLGNGNGTGDFADHSGTSGATSRYTLPEDPDIDLTAYENADGTVTVNLPSDSNLNDGFDVVSQVNGQQPIAIIPVKENDYYKLVGWINIATGDYYDVSKDYVSVNIDLAEQNVFYADWVAASYENGSDADVESGKAEKTESLADMVTIRMYDYNELFNLYSAKLDQKGSDSEVWSDSLELYDAPSITNTNEAALTDSFVFTNESTAKEGMLEYMSGLSAANSYVGKGNPPLSAADSWDITSPDSAPLNLLFDQTASSLGVNYLGEADYLFEVVGDDDNSYYSFSSKDSSAVYNQSKGRFYVYGKPQYITEDGVEKEVFLPYNEPEVKLSASSGSANYWFGMDMEINFNLPYEAGEGPTDDAYFNIAGEDDILVFLDDELLLDMSGIHDESYGAINFANGTVKLAMTENELESMEGTSFDLKKGNHTLRIFYVNRSARGSDLEIEFDLDPFTYYPIDHEIIPDMSDPSTTVKEKAIGEDTAINMEMTAKLPRIDTNALSDTENPFKLLFHETMDNGLELQNSGSNIAVYLRTRDRSVNSEYYEIKANPDDDCTFHVTVDLSALYSDGVITKDDLGSTELIVVFSVDLPEEITYGSYKSTAWYEGFATYSNSDDSVQEFLSRQDSVELYSYGIAISKYDIGQLEGVDYEGAAIPGAKFTLFKDEACTDPVLRGEDAYTDFSGDNGKVFFYGLADGTYYVKETGIPEGYIAMSEVTEITLDEGLKLEDFDYIYETEIPNMPSIDITGRKIWDDDDDEDGDRPDSITLRLYGDGLVTDALTVTADDYWSYEFTGLPMYDSKLEVITYTLTEDAISGYTPAYNEYDFTNTHTPEMTSVFVTIRWEDDTKAERPESITLELYMNGEATGITMTLSADNKWTGIFTGLYEYNEGILNVYTVQEAEIEGYITTVSGDATTGFVVTNAHVPYGTEPGPDQGPIPKGTEPGPVYGGSGSGSDNDSGGDAYSNNTEVKNGTWILEGALFTYPDGTHPSNEYLNIDGEIWAFYTNGYAVNKKHTQYYTDEAIAAAGNIPTATGTWDVCGWWYEYTDGTYPSNGWARLAYNGKTYWYHFDVDGWMDYGWYYENGNTYYLDSKRDGWRGHMFTGWHEIDGYWYYFSEDGETYGRLVKDTTTPDGYRVDENGRWYE